MINPIVKTIELGDGRTITLETGKLAKQADGAVMLRMGNTMLLATVCAAKDAVPGTDFMPLQVEYKEKYSAFGRFPGGFTKREGKASDYEILTCRLLLCGDTEGGRLHRKQALTTQQICPCSDH